MSYELEGMVEHHAKRMRAKIAEYRSYRSNKTSIVYAACAESARSEVYRHGAMKRRYQRAMG